MLFEEYQYDIEINSDDPQADQPDKILIALKPHQRAALHKALVFEKFGKINYNLQNSIIPVRRNTLVGELYIKSNIAIFGDVVGYGKTLTALSLIASNNTNDIRNNNQVIQSFYKDSGFFSAFMEKDNRNINYINTTFVIVPRGPVYTQWHQAINNQTTLKAVFIDGLNFIKRYMPPEKSNFTVLNNYFKEYDLVLIKNTTLKVLMEYYTPDITDDNLYHPLLSWDRIMIDEAHDIINKIPLYNFKFIWLISATYQSIIMNHGTRGSIAQTCLSILNNERLNILLVKGKSSFVMQSFNIPEPIEHIYLCKQPANITAVQPFLSQQVQERLNANDIQGAIREMGGTNETENDIIDLVTREIKREIHNKEREIEYISSLDISAELKEHRTLLQNVELNRLKDKLQNLIDRVSALSEKTCPICYENYDSPIMIQCTHIFCGQCLIQWIKARGNTCPTCRDPINSRSLTAIVSEKQNNNEDEDEHEFLSKEDTLIKLLNEKTDAKFLVFSRIDSGFFTLIAKLRANNISFGELKGSTSHMNTILDRFKSGQLKVILLNTYYAGSGIDISFATDVVIFHAMGLDRVQAIGRAQRQGRTTQLHIHTLMYPHEVEQDSRI
jgi:hypothetical protein